MAVKKDAGPVVEIDRPQDEAPARPDIANQPKMVIAGGRGKVGKSTFLRWAVERNRNRGGTPVIADADRTNPTLFTFFPDAIRPPSSADEDVRLWLNELADTQIERRSTCFLDLGGGDLTLRQWTADLDLAPFLQRYGVTPVLLHVLGSDIDDLAYIRDLEKVFAPEHTAIILNEGMVPPGRSPLTVFEPIISHPIFTAATGRGAIVLRMPRLGCMQDIDRRRISFEDAEEGRVKDGQERLPPTMRQMVSLWRKDMESSAAAISSWIS